MERARRTLVQALTEGARDLPGSGWVHGQLVRYLVEDGRPAEALERARACGAARWWCRSLEGYALHHLERFAAADSTYATARRVMPLAMACRWRSLSLLLEGDARERHDRLGCERRRAFEERAWRLGDPLFAVPGNERRTEHFARLTLARMQEDAAGPYGDYWGDDLHELLVRYGHPVAWERLPRPPYRPGGRPTVVAHHADPAYRFLPVGDGLTVSGPPEAEHWRLDDPRPRSEYAPSYADTFGDLEHRISLFQRGDSVRLIAAYRLPDDSLRPEPPVLAALYAAPAAARPGTAPSPVDGDVLAGPSLLLRRDSAGTRGVFRASLPARPLLLSLEALHRPSGRAWRHRTGLSPFARLAGTPGISDLLLYRPGAGGGLPGDSAAGDPAGLWQLAGRAVAAHRLAPGERIGVYWELYGPRARLAGHRVSLALRETEDGWLDALVEGLGLGDGDGPAVRLGWRGRLRGPGERVHPASLVLTVPEGAAAGEYVLEISVRAPGREPLVAARSFRVTAPGR